MIPTLSDNAIDLLIMLAACWLALSTILLAALLSTAKNRGALAYEYRPTRATKRLREYPAD